MRNLVLGLLLLASSQTCLLYSQNSKPTGFYFGGREFHPGMPEGEAINQLSECCTLSPPVGSIKDDAAAPAGETKGYFILSKGKSSQGILGGIWFKNHKVASISHELADSVDPSDDNLVAFVRAFKRSLPEGATNAFVTVTHEQASNGESDIVTLLFPDGRTLIIRIVTLDAGVNSKRDSVSFEEVLGSFD